MPASAGAASDEHRYDSKPLRRIKACHRAACCRPLPEPVFSAVPCLGLRRLDDRRNNDLQGTAMTPAGRASRGSFTGQLADSSRWRFNPVLLLECHSAGRQTLAFRTEFADRADEPSSPLLWAAAQLDATPVGVAVIAGARHSHHGWTTASLDWCHGQHAALACIDLLSSLQRKSAQ